MDKRRLTWITWGFTALVVLVAALMLTASWRRGGSITLPASLPESGGSAEGDPSAANLPTVVAVTPETVQTAIATLSRPEAYTRKVKVEQFWGGGSRVYETTVAVRGGWSRVDRTMPDGRVRTTLTDGEITYIWYDGQEPVYTAAAGGVTADREQTIPTYEDVLSLPVSSIAAADYRPISGVSCIYAETSESGGAYVQRYWVGVDTGLLTAAEKLENGETVYRMSSLSVDQTAPETALFVLPDGTALFTGGAA